MTRSRHWRREPFIPIQFLQNELTRFLEDCLQTGQRGAEAATPTDLEPTGWTPLVDVYETPEETVVVAELPGVDPAQVELSITGNLLVLRGTKEIPGLPESQPQPRECGHGAFHREIEVSDDVDLEAALAEARHGVLKIRLPRRKSSIPRNIPIRPS